MNIKIAREEKAAPAWFVWAALWIVYLVWGSTYLAIRYVVETMPPFLAGGVRFVAAGLVMQIVLMIRRGPKGVRVTPKEILACTFVGGALLFAGNGLVMVAEQSIPSGLAALIVAAVPLWVVVLRSIFKDRVPRDTLIGVVVGFAGVGILVLPGSSGTASTTGMFTVVAASAFWACGSFFSKRVPLPDDPFTSTTIQMLCGGVIMLLAGLVTGEGSRVDFDAFSTSSIIGLVYLIFAGSLLAFTAYTWLLQHAPISKVATYAYVNPVVAIFLGWALLGEPVTLTIAIGATVIVGSVAYIVRRESRAAPELVEPHPEPLAQPAPN
ncbi:MAG: EamA family transporter [Actinomycetota bacterium]